MDLNNQTCPVLTAAGRRLFQSTVDSERDLHEFIYFAALFAKAGEPSARGRALLRAGLAYLFCNFVPDEYDRFLIQRGNPETKLNAGGSKKVRDTWAFMNYKRALQTDPNISYTAKSGSKMRAEFADSLLAALRSAFERWTEFQPMASSMRADQLAGRVLSSSVGLATLPVTQNGDLCQFISENYPDGSLLPFNTRFTKVWVLRNSGDVPWFNRWQRRHTPHSPLFPQTAEAVRVPTTLPGETARIAVDVLTTRVSGFSEVRFKMVDQNGVLCWPTFYPYGSAFVIETRDFDPALIRSGMDRVPERF